MTLCIAITYNHRNVATNTFCTKSCLGKAGCHREEVHHAIILGAEDTCHLCVGDVYVIDGKAILFESGIYAKIPTDLPEKLALSALDVAGAPAQTAKLVKPGDTVLIIGAGGKSGMLCCYEAMKRAGVTGKVIGLCHSQKSADRLKALGFCHTVFTADATQPVPVMEKISELTGGQMCDVTINVYLVYIRANFLDLINAKGSKR